MTGPRPSWMPEHRPTHLVATPGDRHSLCGVKDPLPRMLARFVERKRVAAREYGYEFEVCGECEVHRGCPTCGSTDRAYHILAREFTKDEPVPLLCDDPWHGVETPL